MTRKTGPTKVENKWEDNAPRLVGTETLQQDLGNSTVRPPQGRKFVGEYHPGACCRRRRRCSERYGVGRASLREALRILEVHGLIKIKPGPGGGPMVDQVDSRDFGRTTSFFFQVLGATIGDLLEARTVIEPMMARLAAQRMTPENAGRRSRRSCRLKTKPQQMKTVLGAMRPPTSTV